MDEYIDKNLQEDERYTKSICVDTFFGMTVYFHIYKDEENGESFVNMETESRETFEDGRISSGRSGFFFKVEHGEVSLERLEKDITDMIFVVKLISKEIG